jgi:hypothetical protein
MNPVLVQACTNLGNPVWTRLEILTLTNGTARFNEPAKSTGARFYRLTAP